MKGPVLTTIRGIFLSVTLELYLFGVVLWFVRPEPVPGQTWLLVVLVIVVEFGVGFAGLIWINRRSPVPSDPKNVAGWYRGRFFVKLGLLQATPLMGFVGVFVTGRFWMFLLGLGLALVAAPLVAPTGASLHRDQELLRAHGNPVDLLLVLTQPPAGQDPVPGRA